MPSDQVAPKKPRERWTPEEHELFLEGLKKYHRDWRAVERHIGTKTAVQIRSHAQKFFAKAEKEPGTVDFELPPPRPKRKPGTAAAAASASAGPTVSMPMGLLQPGFAHVHASGAPHTLFPSLLSHTPGPVYPTAAMSTGTTSNTVPLNMMVPAPDTAGAASAFSAPPLTGQSSLLPSPTKQPGATAAATAAAPAVAAASTIPRAVQHAAAAGVAGLPVGDPADPTSDAVLNKIAAAAVAAASTVAHAVIAAAGPQYVHVIQQLAHHDDRLRFLTCPISELMSSVATTTAIAPPHTASLSPSVHGAKDAADAPHVGSTEPGSSGIGSNSACRTAQLAATRLASAQPAAAPVHPSPSGALAAPAVDGAWPGLAFRPPPGGASPSSLPFMNQMMGLPASNDALPSIHTSDLLAAPDAMLPSLGLSGSLPDSALGPAARNKSRSLGTKVGDAGGSEAADARGERGPSSDRPLFCSVPLNSGAMAQAAMHAQQLQTEGSQGYGEQGSGGDGSRDRTSADGGAAHGISAGNGSGGSAQPRSGGSGSKSGKQSGNRPAPAGGTTAPASPSPFQLPEGMKPKGANAEESSRFYQQYYAEMIRRGTEGLRSIQQSMPQKAHALPDLGSMPGVPPSGAAAASPAGKSAEENAAGGRGVGQKALAETSRSPRHKRQRISADGDDAGAAGGPAAHCSIRARVMQSEWPMETEVEQHDTATSGQHGPHAERSQRDAPHRGSAFTRPQGGAAAAAAANGSDSGSNQPRRPDSAGATISQGAHSREGSQRVGAVRSEVAKEAVTAQ